jgi:hypothetical protein
MRVPRVRVWRYSVIPAYVIDTSPDARASALAAYYRAAVAYDFAAHAATEHPCDETRAARNVASVALCAAEREALRVV